METNGPIPGDPEPELEILDKWPERSAFRRRSEEFRDREGITIDELAPKLGTTPGTLKMWIYGKGARPRLEALFKAARVFGCDLAEFYPDEGPSDAATANGIVEASGEEDRVYLRALDSIERAREICRRDGVDPSAENVVLVLEGRRGRALRHPRIDRALFLFLAHLRGLAVAGSIWGAWRLFARTGFRVR